MTDCLCRSLTHVNFQPQNGAVGCGERDTFVGVFDNCVSTCASIDSTLKFLPEFNQRNLIILTASTRLKVNDRWRSEMIVSIYKVADKIARWRVVGSLFCFKRSHVRSQTFCEHHNIIVHQVGDRPTLRFEILLYVLQNSNLEHLTD